MNQEEHLMTVRELARRADQESSDGGNELIAAGLFWGAFAHCLITIALSQGLPHDSHGAFEGIARHLDTAQGGNIWRSRFGAAAQLHSHFHHGELLARELRTHRRAASEGTQELLRILPTRH